MNSRCPCRRECPDRTPGCNCEKRAAWRASLEEIKKEQRREKALSLYQRDAVHKSKKTGVRRRHRI